MAGLWLLMALFMPLPHDYIENLQASYVSNGDGTVTVTLTWDVPFAGSKIAVWRGDTLVTDPALPGDATTFSETLTEFGIYQYTVAWAWADGAGPKIWDIKAGIINVGRVTWDNSPGIDGVYLFVLDSPTVPVPPPDPTYDTQSPTADEVTLAELYAQGGIQDGQEYYVGAASYGNVGGDVVVTDIVFAPDSFVFRDFTANVPNLPHVPTAVVVEW